jgi:AcrR family transcriptional regulator
MILRVSESRDRVTQRALEMFASHGYDAVSMRDLGQALNMQAPSIYSHFPSKQALLLATLAPLLDGLDDVFRALPDAPVSVEQRRDWLRSWIHVLVTYRLASRVAMYDRAVMVSTGLQPRMWNMHERLLEALASFGVTDGTLANAVIGGIARPIHEEGLDLNEDRLVSVAERLIETARTP